MKILDIGTGEGGFFEITEDRLNQDSWLKEFGGYYAYGVDINSDSVIKAKNKINNGSNFCIADGRKLPFKEKSFDIIHDNDVLRHIKDYENVLQDIFRVMHNYSVLIIKESVDDLSFNKIFTSEKLIQSVEKYFFITYKKYYWRCPLSEIWNYLGLKEPFISLWINQKISRFFQISGLDKKICSHFVLTAVKRVGDEISI